MNLSFIFMIFNSYFLTSLQLNNNLDDKCNTCRTFAQKFVEELERTKKGNFGGGNTDWEDRKLGKYLTSETRFEEIVENLCPKKDYECYKFFESQEELLLDMFQNNHKELEKFLQEEFCISVLELCCSKKTFGPKCLPCKTKWNKICSGNGQCDGNGTRIGSGECVCNFGYSGTLCDECSSMHYVHTKTDTSMQCEVCESPCISCTSKTKCLTCQSGYFFHKHNQSCIDINECEENKNLCGDKECINIPGSFKCYDKSRENNENEFEFEKYKIKVHAFKKTIIVGISVLCITSSLIQRNYLMAIVSALFGFVIGYLTL